MSDEQNIIAALLQSYRFIIPEVVLGVAACVIWLGGTFRAGRNLWAVAALVALGVAGAALALTADAGFSDPGVARAATFAGSLTHDSLALLIKTLAIAGGVVLVLFAWEELPDRQAADFHACLLIVVAGMCLTGAANDLVVLFLALELTSIPTYIMLYLPRRDTAAQEAALKYFLLSIFSSALTLFGFSYLYGLAGTTNLGALLDTVYRSAEVDVPAVAQVAVILVVAGLGFRITAVPFHFYAPDVYQGTATSMAALLAFVMKVVGFVALLRVFGFILPTGVSLGEHALGTGLSAQLPILLWFLAAVTMFLGNVLALLQENLKRLLAYSSVAHAGYMLIALAVAPYLRRTGTTLAPDAIEALLFYLAAYGAMTIGAFAVIAYLDSPQRPVEMVDDLSGVSRSHPGVALMMMVFLFSLIGVPLTAGFAGKLFVFLSAMGVPRDPVTGQYATLFLVLAVLGMLNAAIGAWYYLRIIAVMYLRTPVRPLEKRGSWPALVTLWVCVVLTIGLGIPPGVRWLLEAAGQATAPQAAVRAP
ncbi:MAG: NADH-quinone oxidoreductase subunit N [Gemmataceae bacterium]|nr:NADH-quinone oxidoreductase subunit N [Gemmataceae bacterium]